MEWSNSASCNIFKKVVINVIRPELNQAFDINNSEGLKSLTRIKLWLNHLADHKFRHNFQDCVSSVCSCSQETEMSTYFLLYFLNYHCARQTLFEKNYKINSTTLKQNKQQSFFCLKMKIKQLFKINPPWRQLSSYRTPRDLKPHYLIKSLSGMASTFNSLPFITAF